MSKLTAVCTVAMSLMVGSALAQTPAPPPMAMSGPNAKMSNMDMMMVKNCKAMPRKKMRADKECQDYMKNHPDWMKARSKTAP